ncbi:peptidase M24, structural domain-containing protein [Circinella umbellata]|nr:peptidase M24, structural domain-containing protein [Circinella umbellata]
MSPYPVPLHLHNDKLPTRQHCLKVIELMKNHDLISAATTLAATTPRKTHQQEHRREKENEKSIIFLSGAVDSVREGTDVELEFRQLSDFYYLTGVDEPGFCVMIDLQTHLVYLIPPTVIESETIWKGKPDTSSELLQKYDADYILEEKELSDIIFQQDYRKVHVLDTFFSSYNNSSNSSSNFFKRILLQGESKLLQQQLQFDTYTLRLAINEARLTKFPYEIDMIRQATTVSSHAHMALWQHRHSCTTEAQLAAYFRWTCACSGLDRQAYIPIVASGPRASTLHYTKNNMPLPTGQQEGVEHALVLVDAGAEYRYYGSDITRTFPVSGKFSPEAKTIYNIVLAMQEAVLARLSAGVYWSDMEDLAVQILCNKLTQIGILIGDQDELIRLGIPYAFYFHSLGHSVGLDVHDVGGRTAHHSSDKEDHKLEYSTFMVDRPLEPNMVITVEPGLYFNDAYIRIWSQYPGFAKYFNMKQLQRYYPVGGVRIEDSVLITSTGYENLTIAPKQPEEIEAVMAAAAVASHSFISSSSSNYHCTNNSNALMNGTAIPATLMLVPPFLSGSNHSSNNNTSNTLMDYHHQQPRASSSFSTTTTSTTTDDANNILPTPTSSPLNHSYCFSEE